MQERNLEYYLPNYLTAVFPTVHLDSDIVDVPMKTPRIRYLLPFCSVCSIIMHIVDMVFDYNIAIRYLLSDKIAYFIWTICIIIIPSLTNCIISGRMQTQDKKMISDNLNNSKLSRLMIQNKFCFVLAVIFQLAPVLHYYENLRYALKTRRCEKSQDRVGARQNYLKMLKEDQDVALLRVFECFLEAAPQQILQLTLLLKHHDMKIYFVHQIASIISSFVSMGWAMASYHRSIRIAQEDKSNISNVGTAFQFLWHFFITVARILSISVIASIWPIPTIIFCVMHCIIMTIWIVVDSRGILDFCRNYNNQPHIGPRSQEYIYSILFAAVIGTVHIFIYFNTVKSKTFWKHIFFYTLCFLENISCNIVWAYTSPPEVKCAWYFSTCLISCALSFLLGIAAMIIYYTVFHPSKKQHDLTDSLQITQTLDNISNNMRD